MQRANKNIFVMLPTYNEAENIAGLIRAIRTLHLPNLHILVVDDNSADGTSHLVTSLMQKDKQLHLLVRTTQRGRGTAGIAGFRKSLDMGADIICEMDADFSHNPKYLPSLLRALKSADMVLGSRAVPGGSDTDRPRFRQILTKLANLYIALVLGLRVKDCNSGYRCFKRHVLETINLDTLTAQGPGIVQELLYRAYLHGFRITEVPISFVERKKGTSKLGFSHLYQGYLLILKLKLLRLLGKI